MTNPPARLLTTCVPCRWSSASCTPTRHSMPAVAVSDRTVPVTRALAWSLGLHVLAVLVAALPFVREALEAWQDAAHARAAAAVEPKAERVEVAVMVPEVEVERRPPPPAESFIRTDGLPEAAPDPENRRFISDRNTRAASRLPADPTATEWQPTQEGIDIPVVEIIRRDQSDGEDETLPPAPGIAAAAAPAPQMDRQPPGPEAAVSEPPAPSAAEPLLPAASATSAAAMVDAATAADPPSVDREAPQSPAVETQDVPPPVEERLALAPDSENRVPLVDPAPATPSARAATTPPPRVAASLRDPEVASRPPPSRPPSPPPAPPSTTPPPGFSGLRTPTRLRGTISNQGASSVDAEDTPTGRYMKQVTSAIEKEWHRKRRLNRDFVTFGTIKLEFHVDARGQVHNLTIKNRSGANAIMQDFTLNAVLDAQLPQMPSGLTEVLDREMLLISYDIIVY